MNAPVASVALECTKHSGERVTTADLRVAAESLDVDGDYRADNLRDAADEIERLRNAISDTTSERDALKRRLTAMFPLFEEARDALTAIPLASAKLHNVRLDLADRMDDVGDPERWAKREAP